LGGEFWDPGVRSGQDEGLMMLPQLVSTDKLTSQAKSK